MNVCRTLFRPTLPLVFAMAAGVTPAWSGEPITASPHASGLGLRGSDSVWPRWQGRLGLISGSPAALAGGRYDPGLDTITAYGGERPQQSLSLFGDYYFLQQGIAGAGYSGGLRATGGLIYGPRSAAWSSLPAGLTALSGSFSAVRRNFSLANPGLSAEEGNSSVPYVGVGYTGLQSLRATGGGWGFSADVGLVALQPRSSVRFGQQGLSESLRDLQLSPLLQLGASYSF